MTPIEDHSGINDVAANAANAAKAAKCGQQLCDKTVLHVGLIRCGMFSDHRTLFLMGFVPGYDDSPRTGGWGGLVRNSDRTPASTKASFHTLLDAEVDALRVDSQEDPYGGTDRSW